VPVYVLQWSNVTAIGKVGLLTVPLCDLYVPILRTALPAIVTGQSVAGPKSTCSTRLNLATSGSRQELEDLIGFLSHYPLVPRTRHLDGHFTNELSQAFVLARNFETPEGTSYTEVGALERDAKYNGDKPSAERLGVLLAEAIKAHPYYRLADAVAAVPGARGKKSHLPDALVTVVADKSGLRPLRLERPGEAPPAKGLTVEKKLAFLKDAFRCGEDVQQKRIVLIDDLYQSGATLFSIAAMLGRQGAQDVVALACVKSWRDSDNV
jgi:hypothetical protein